MRRLIAWLKYQFQRCTHEGCWKQGFPCFMEMYTETPDEYACSDHAQQMGYCVGCGQFWGGVDSFDFGTGLCPQCRDQIEADSPDYDAEEEEYCYHPEEDRP